MLISVFFTVIMLIGLLAYGSWSQFRNGQTVSAPIRITAQAGPERIIPEDPGGLRIENQDLGVLNPDVINPVILDLRPEAAVVIEEILDPELIDPASIAPTVAATANSVDQNIDIQVNIAATPEVAVAAAAAVSAPGAIPGEETPPQTAEASQPALVPTPRPQTIPVREALARGSAVAGASSVATGSDPDLITVAPRELHVQEGSYVSLQSAKASYASLQQRAGSRLSGITAQYHRVQVDGRTWYRLYLVGFSDLSAAAALGGTLGRDSRNWLIRNA